MTDDGYVSVDEYNLPDGILGLHPDAFYGAMGRIICVSAVLEDQVTSLRHALANAGQGRFTRQPVSEQIKNIRMLPHGLPAHAANRVDHFVTAAEMAFDRRNELVHSSFPAQPSRRLFGHRPSRSKEVTDGSADLVESNLEELKELIGELAKLVLSFNQVFELCAARPSPANASTMPSSSTT